MPKLRAFAIQSVSAALILVASALAPPGVGAAEPQHGGTLIFGGETEWGFLDPHIDASGATHRVNYQLFEGLFWRDYTKPNDGSPPPIIPQLATSYDASADGTEYTFHLRQGVKFHDGTPFNAAAVEFNVRRVWDEDFEYFYDRTGSLKSAVWRELKDIEVIDDLTIKLTLLRIRRETPRRPQGGVARRSTELHGRCELLDRRCRDDAPQRDCSPSLQGVRGH